MTIDEAIAIMEDPTKHTMTCSQGELTEWLTELKEAKNLLYETGCVLSCAFFINNESEKRAIELYDKIKKILGRA